MNELFYRIMKVSMMLLLILSMCVVARQAAEYVGSRSVVKKELCVVIDPGHGGIDPGKVGINGCLEKDVNLQIAKKLQKLLIQNNIKAILTRQRDQGLYSSNASNKKVDDLKKRIAFINDNAPDLVVSIHQNSYPEEYVKGAQVFYYAGSEKGEEIANILQENLRIYLNPENRRVAKANESYYMLKKTSFPIVIAECGFLSNNEEAKLLLEDEYQEKVAWALHMGIMQYLNGNDIRN